MKKHSLSFPFLLLSSLVLVGCGNQPTPSPVVEVVTLKEIVVIPPSKLEYKVNQELDLTGMVVKAIFSDGSIKDLNPNEYKVEGFSSENPGTCKVSVSYTSEDVKKTSSFNVTIVAEEYLPISLYQNDSKIYFASLNEKSVYVLKTYRHKEFGEAPFIDFEEFVPAFIAYGEYTRSFAQVSNGVYKFTRPSGENKTGSITFDTNEQKIIITNAAGIYTDVFGMNNGFGDFAAGAKLVRGSKKTKIVKEGKPRTIDLKPYGYRIESQNNRLYVPASLISGLLIAPATSGLTYNGHDYFVRQSIDNMDISPLAFSSDKGFAMISTGGTTRQAYKPVPVKDETEAYRYLAKQNVASTPDTIIDLVLKKDGTGFAQSNDNPIMRTVDLDIKWSEEDDIITMSISRLIMGEPIDSPRTVKIRKDNSTFYGQEKRSESIALDNYRGMIFALDLNFGLKDFKQITSFDEYFTSKGRKEGLLSTDAETYQDNVARIIATDFDEMHSVAMDQSYFGDFDKVAYFSAKVTDNEGHTGYNGERNRKFISTLVQYKQYYDMGENARDTYEVKDNTAVLKFDNFYYRDALAFNNEAYVTEDYAAAQKAYYKSWTNNDTYKAFAIAFNDIAKNENIKNVVFDISMNTGGEVRVMPLISAFYNRDPSLLIQNNIDGSIIDLHYEVDLNGDGEYATEQDSFEGKYNFYFLTGGVSFSCGNAFPTMAKNSKKAKIIGELSAGGSCMVNAFVTLDGLTYNTSSPYQFILDNGDSGYVYNENGVPLDNALAISEAYNMTKLVTFLNGLNNNN